MDLVTFILNLDRRIIYTIVAICVVVPLIVAAADCRSCPRPKCAACSTRIDALPEGSHVLIAADFDPASKPELLPESCMPCWPTASARGSSRTC